MQITRLSGLARHRGGEGRRGYLGLLPVPNHVHAVVTPKDEEGLWRTFGDLHRRYTGHINARNRWTGHLWQARFAGRSHEIQPIRRSPVDLVNCHRNSVIQEPVART
jgi:hypothetical protein